MKKSIKLAVIILVSSLVVSCSSSTDLADNVSVDTVRISMMKFNPEVINVNVGDSIVWINEDMVEHDVTEESKTWTSNSIPANDGVWKMEITEGFSYFCSIHPTMVGTVNINE